ncbi:MAG: aminoacyl-tRNA hydrolase [Opitutales bacterium]
MSIAVIAGLGNPGQRYRNTRHNIGFDIVDQLAIKLGGIWRKELRFEAEVTTVLLGERKLLLAKPLTFMNDSGRSLGAILRYLKLGPESALVVYDDLTLELGRTKLSNSGSSGGHNGIADLLEKIGPGFVRYRVGIGAKPSKEMDLADYVLSQFKPTERETLTERMPEYLGQIRLIIDKGIETAFNNINQRIPTPHERSNNQ